MIKAIIGLGNPGNKYQHTRHNIGFKIIDNLAQGSNSPWNSQDILAWTSVTITSKKVLLIKPLTGMNLSGDIYPFLQKKNIKPEEILVIHDELELPFGTLKIRQGGSARGHNGIRSLIAHMGDSFYRLRVGIGRPASKDDVPTYVLSTFNESTNDLIDNAIKLVREFIA